MRSVKALINLALLGQNARAWYSRARETVLALAKEAEVCPEYVADIMAITSPGVKVAENVTITKVLLFGRKLQHPYGRNVASALSHYHTTGKIRGPKTSAFARNLRGDLAAITLDRWMARILQVDERWSRRDRTKAEKRIRAAARFLGWEPAEVQAALWHVAMVRSGKVETVKHMELA